MKRKSQANDPEPEPSTRKRARAADSDDLEEDVSPRSGDLTPSKRRSARTVSSNHLQDSDGAADNEEDILNTSRIPIPLKRPGARASLLRRMRMETSPEAEEAEEEEFLEEIEVVEDVEAEVDATPSKKKRGRPKGSKNTPKTARFSELEDVSYGKKLFSTPVKRIETQTNGTPSRSRNVDRSARRKSARAIIERTLGENASDEEEDELARHIYDLEGEEEDADESDKNIEEKEDADDPPSVPETPSKRGRGRPKGAKNRPRSPTPPQDLPPHELYFAQNRGASSKTSSNTLSSLALLDHEEYFTLLREYQDPHAEDLKFLQDLHARSFNQWQFELSQNFNICIYGFGSKRSLLSSFATHIYNSISDHTNHKLVVVNGYVHNISVRDIFSITASAITSNPTKLGSQPAEMLESLNTLLLEHPEKQITLIINSIDATPLRRAATQTLLSRLASHPQIMLIASADHPNFPLLWDSTLRSTYNFLFHDCTTFQPYISEIDVVDEVHRLLGRSGRRVGGKEGVSFVLKSLPVKAKSLFQVLVAEQLAAMDDGGPLDFGHGEDNENEYDEFGDVYENGNGTGNGRLGKPGSNEPGVEYRVLYQKAVEDFICPNEMTFRTLLKE